MELIFGGGFFRKSLERYLRGKMDMRAAYEEDERVYQ